MSTLTTKPHSRPRRADLVAFAVRLAEARHTRGLTGEALSRLAGLSEGTVGNCECAQHGPSADTLSRLAAALGMTMDELWLGRGPTSCDR